MTLFSSDLFFSVGTALSLTIEQEEVNISLALRKVYSKRFELLFLLAIFSCFFSALFIVLLLHKRLFQCPDVMEIEIQCKIRV